MRPLRWRLSERLRLVACCAVAVAAAAMLLATRRGAGALPGQTFVSLTFDDGRVSQRLALAMLNQRGMHGTFYVNSGHIGGFGVFTRADLDAVAASGDEIGGHTIDHVFLTRLPPDAQRHEICDDRQRLLAWGYNPVDFAYPYGDRNAATDAIVQSCGYRSGRAVGTGTGPLPPRDAFDVPAPTSIHRQDSLAFIESLVVRAQQSGGGWVILVFHTICDGCADQYSTSPQTLAGLLDWLQTQAGQGVVVETVAQALGFAAPPGPVASVRVFPNPWRADRHQGTRVTLDHLSPQSSVGIFDPAGRLVRSLSAAASGAASWDLADGAGQRVASGIYVYVVTDGQGRRSSGTITVLH